MMIRGVKPGAFEHNSDGLVDFLFNVFFPHSGATHERMVTKGLLFFELHTAIFALIYVDWHDCFP